VGARGQLCHGARRLAPGSELSGIREMRVYLAGRDGLWTVASGIHVCPEHNQGGKDSMSALHRTMRRAGTVLAATAAITLAGSTMASAHHCYKDQWQEAAYQAQSKGNTAWMPLSDLGTAFLIGPDFAQQCGYVADDAVQQWMAANGVTQEPLIHMRATVGGGALYNSGKEPKPFSYLDDDDFGMLTMAIVDGMATCAPDWEMPME